MSVYLASWYLIIAVDVCGCHSGELCKTGLTSFDPGLGVEESRLHRDLSMSVL